MATPQGYQNIEKLSQANSKFALNLYQALSQKRAGENIFFSPISISTALAMTHLGAHGNTSTQMSQVLRFIELEESQLHSTFAELNKVLYNADRPYTIKSANRLFGQEGYTFLQDFIEASAKHYSAELTPVDFTNKTEEARRLINSWVYKETEGKIQDLLAAGSLDPLSRLVLVNAIYFKGSWGSKFNVKATKNAVFFIGKDKTAEVPMMTQKAKFDYCFDKDLDCQMLELPYVGGHLSMILVLPTKVDGLPCLESKLNVDLLSRWPKIPENSTVVVTIPKLKFEQDFLLNDQLAAMGMPDLFSVRKADLSGINGNNELYVSTIIHKAFVEVNEEGTEAVAATRVKRFMKGIHIDESIHFTANHPFMFFIRDNRSNAILFLGRYNRPPTN